MTVQPATAPRRPSLTADLVQSLGDRIRDGRLQAGSKLPPEGAIMEEFGVSRTVVREAISRLQAAGMVETRHGIGTFVLGHGDASSFRIPAAQQATLKDVISVLELRIGVETESAALAAMRRTPANLESLRSALQAFTQALAEGRDAVGPDFQFHLEIARATQNARYADLMATLGGTMIPRARLEATQPASPESKDYLRRVNLEHESILRAIEQQDPDAARAAMRTHLANSKERRQKLAENAKR
jgi:DNA-binding FadR family transcriptional regulator